jgi:hypothetical protein
VAHRSLRPATRMAEGHVRARLRHLLVAKSRSVRWGATRPPRTISDTPGRADRGRLPSLTRAHHAPAVEHGIGNGQAHRRERSHVSRPTENAPSGAGSELTRCGVRRSPVLLLDRSTRLVSGPTPGSPSRPTQASRWLHGGTCFPHRKAPRRAARDARAAVDAGPERMLPSGHHRPDPCLPANASSATARHERPPAAGEPFRSPSRRLFTRSCHEPVHQVLEIQIALV